MGFTIYHPLITLEIKLEELDKLHIHEEIIKSRLRILVEDIKADKCLKHPIIVDKKRLVVLDGNHRIAAARELGWRYMPVCLLDYENPKVVISRWYRLVNPRSDIERLKRLIEELGLSLEDRSLKEARELVEKRDALASIASSSKCFSISGVRGDIRDFYRVIKEIEVKLITGGYTINYGTESDALSKMALGKIFSILIVPTVSKEEVVKAALSGKVLSHKATRHIIPLRPLFLNVPLDWLNSELSLKKVNEKLFKYLSARDFRKLPPGQFIDRRYDEELFIFV